MKNEEEARKRFEKIFGRQMNVFDIQLLSENWLDFFCDVLLTGDEPTSTSLNVISEKLNMISEMRRLVLGIER